jgi:hypothetical protein
MRKALIPAFLLVLVAVVLGSTVFREQVVSAATTPFQNVVVQNTTTNPIPVQQVGTSTTSVSGTVGIESSKNTVKLDSAGNTVNLGSTDSNNLANADTHLGNIDTATGKLKFDGSGKLETTGDTAAPAPVTGQCLNLGHLSDFTVKNDKTEYTLCSGDFYATDITAAGMDDWVVIDFLYNGNTVLQLWGGGTGGFGADSYQMDLTHPLHVDTVEAICSNSSSDCNFTLSVLGS